MTGTQQMLMEGCQANLAYRRFKLRLEGTAYSFDALVPPVAPDTSQFQLGENEREYSRIHILRVHLPKPNPIETGKYLLDDANERRHRVAEIYDHPTSNWVVFTCESVPMT